MTQKASDFDTYHMPRVDELIELLGPPPATSPPWTSPSRSPKPPGKKTAFATPGGTIPVYGPSIGVHGAAAWFQRMMDQLLRPHQAYAAAYKDNVIIHSASWDVYLRQLRAVLPELRRAGLTANPAECCLGLE